VKPVPVIPVIPVAPVTPVTNSKDPKKCASSKKAENPAKVHEKVEEEVKEKEQD